MVRLKSEIQEKYLKHRDMHARFRELVSTVENELQSDVRIKKAVDAVEAEIRERLEARLVKELSGETADEDLVRQAFDERFEEIKLRTLREDLPRILKPEERGSFHDPDWDKRDDPVPGWVTIVHLLFMAWTIVTAHHPPLFISGMLFFLGFAVVAGALTGGGLTIIANAPNPAAVSILKKYFTNGIGAGGILRGALAPTVIMLLIHLFIR